MNESMKALLGYDPDEIVEKFRSGFVETAEQVVAEFDASPVPNVEEIMPLLRSLTIGNILLSYQISALASRPSGDVMWPAAKIHEALREAGRELGKLDKEEETE